MKQFGFSQADFDTFSIDGLEPRMEQFDQIYSLSFK